MGAIKDAYDIIKELVKSTKSMVDTVQATEFCSQLLEVQSMIMDAREENEQLKQEISSLKKQIEELNVAKLPDGIKWSIGGIGEYRDNGKLYYICRHCYDSSKKIMHTMYCGGNEYYCRTCNMKYYMFKD